MKRAVSISLGHASRDARAVLRLLGHDVLLERIGTNGNLERAAELFGQLDGQVDAFGLGGASLALSVYDRSYPLRSVLPIVRHVHRTPLVDGAGLRNTLECHAAQFVDDTLGDRVGNQRVLCAVVCDRWGLYAGFRDRGYECLMGDLIFGLKVPVALRSERALGTLMTLLAPVVTRLPFSMLYPIGHDGGQQAGRILAKSLARHFAWASVIAGDCHYLTSFMPFGLRNKIVVTNTTTDTDADTFRRRGVRHLVTTTPIVEGRSFGTNLVEAAIVAAAGKGRTLSDAELEEAIASIGLRPQYRELS